MRYVPEHEALEQYDAMLEDVYGAVSIAGMEYSTARALKELDPTAYRCGFNDWCDAEDITTDEDEADEDEDEADTIRENDAERMKTTRIWKRIVHVEDSF